MNISNIINFSFKTKTFKETNNLIYKNNIQLKKSLSLMHVVYLGIGVLVGGGIFIVTGIASSLHAGPAITISFFICGFMCICAGFCYAEFASVIRNSGSSYSYIYCIFGKLPAWIIGWFSIIGYLLGAVSVTMGWSKYISDLFYNVYLYIPVELNFFSFLYHNIKLNFILDVPAFIICVFSTIILYKGIKISSFITNISVVIKLLVLISFIFSGIFYINKFNWIPYIPNNTGYFGEYGYSGIFAAITVIFLSFNGFDAICSAAQEVKNPSINIPIAIVVTIVTITILYILTSAIVTGLVHYQHLNVPHVLSYAMKYINFPFLNYFMKIGTIIGLTSVIIISQYTVTRMLLVLLQDNFSIVFLTKIHMTNYTPHYLTFIVGLFMFFFTAISKIQDLVKLSGILILITVFFVCVASLFNKYYYKYYTKFICPYMPLTPLFFIFISIYIFFSYTSDIYVYILFLTSVLLFIFLYNINIIKF